LKAEVVIMDSFSAHGDRSEMLDFLANQKDTVKEVFLVHGDIERMEAFGGALKEKGFLSWKAPTLEEVIEL